MAAKLYVGGLSYNTTEATLKSTFEACGTVASAVIIMDKMTGRSKGFGFVEMGSDEEAKIAIEKTMDWYANYKTTHSQILTNNQIDEYLQLI
jgi:RNA recognition motif-containing protein